MDEALPSPNSTHAKRVLGLAALFFLAVQLAVGLALDRAPLHVRFSEATAALERARAIGPEPDVLIFGSSRFKALVDPVRVEARLRERLGDRAPRVASITFNGGDLIGSEVLLAKVLEAGLRPKLAVIELTPEWVRYPVPFINGQLLRAFTWRDVGAWLPELLTGTKRTLLCARLFPVYCYRNELLTWVTGRAPPYLAAPGDPSQARRHGKDDPEHGAGRWARRMRGYRVSERALRVLERVLDRCREAEIDCVFAEPPLSGVHRELLAREISTKFDEALAREQRERSFDLLDFSARLPDDGFHDSTHGNRSGAERFSVIFADEVIEPRWRARQRR